MDMLGFSACVLDFCSIIGLSTLIHDQFLVVCVFMPVCLLLFTRLKRHRISKLVI